MDTEEVHAQLSAALASFYGGSDAAESVVRMAGVTWRPFTAMALSSTAVVRDGRWYCRKQSLLCPVTCDVPGCAVSTRRENE